MRDRSRKPIGVQRPSVLECGTEPRHRVRAELSEVGEQKQSVRCGSQTGRASSGWMSG